MSMTTVEGDGGTYTGCSHYRRKCKLVAPCCDGVYSCRCAVVCLVSTLALVDTFFIFIYKRQVLSR